MIKQFYVNKSKYFKVWLYITNDSIKHQLFAFTQLNDQKLLFQAI